MTDLRIFGRSGEDVVAEAKMELAVRAAVLIVEGRTDLLALEEHLAAAVAVVIADNKNNALRAAGLLDEQGVGPQVSVLVDRDHDGDRGVGERVIVTSARDLDAELLDCGESLRRICKIRQGKRADISLTDLRARIIELAAPASALLTVVQREELSVKASGLNLKAIQEFTQLEDRIYALARQAIARSRNADVSVDDLAALVTDEISSCGIGLTYCQGHYLHAAIGIVLPGDGGPDKVQASMWVTVRGSEFRSSPTGQAIAEWGLTISVEVFSRDVMAA